MSDNSDSSTGTTMAALTGDKEWWLVCSFRFDKDLWVEFEESNEEGKIRVHVRAGGTIGGDQTRTIDIADLKAALELLEARQQ